MKLKFAIFLLLLTAWHSVFCQIVIYGDTRSQPEIHHQLISRMLKHQPQLAIHTGDLNSKGKEQQEYDRFFSITSPLLDIAPLYAVKGNHEKSRDLFLKNFPSLGATGYTRLEHHGLLIYLLDSTAELNPGSQQYTWLSSALTDSLPGIVVMHHPIFSSGYHGGDEAMQMYLPQLLQKGWILAVFSGHDHDYERSEYKGVSYIVTGGGGSPRREQRTANPFSKVFDMSYHYLVLNPQEQAWSAEVWNLEGRLIDSFVLDASRYE